MKRHFSCNLGASSLCHVKAHMMHHLLPITTNRWTSVSRWRIKFKLSYIPDYNFFKSFIWYSAGGNYTCGWANWSLLFLASEAGKSKVAHPLEYTTTSSRGSRKPRFLADNVEQTKSSTHMSVQIPTTNNCRYKSHKEAKNSDGIDKRKKSSGFARNLENQSRWWWTEDTHSMYLVVLHPVNKDIGAILLNRAQEPIIAVLVPNRHIRLLLDPA